MTVASRRWLPSAESRLADQAAYRPAERLGSEGKRADEKVTIVIVLETTWIGGPN